MKKVLSEQMRVAAKLHHAVFLLQKKADLHLQSHQGLSFMQALILNIIKHHPHTTQSHIVNCTRFTPGAVSRQIELLFEKGFITRITNKQNRRAQIIDLTKEGREVVVRAFDALNDELKEHFSTINKAELHQLDELMGKVILKMDPEYYQFREPEIVKSE